MVTLKSPLCHSGTFLAPGNPRAWQLGSSPTLDDPTNLWVLSEDRRACREMSSVLRSPISLPSIDKAAPTTRQDAEGKRMTPWLSPGRKCLPCHCESAEHRGPIWKMNQHLQELTLEWIPEGVRNQGNASDTPSCDVSCYCRRPLRSLAVG